MSLFERIKLHYFRNALSRRLRESSVRRTSMAFEEIKTVGIVYDRDVRTDESIIRAFAKQLEREGKRVDLLVVTQEKSPSPEAVVPHLTRSDVNWHYIPTGESALLFMNQPFDLLLNLCSSNTHTVDYLAAGSRAKFRVGTSTDRDAPYELVIDPGTGTESRQLIQLVSRYLKIMNVPHDTTS